MKKIAAFIFAFGLVTNVFAHEHEDIIDGVTWYYNIIDEYEAEITFKGAGNYNNGEIYSGDLIIPPKLGGKQVTRIGTEAFAYCNDLVSVKIPDSVRIIARRAFLDSSLISINIPNGVITIEDYAFDCCESLKSITIPASVISIGNGALASCSKLSMIYVESDNPNYKSKNGSLLSKDGIILIRAASRESYQVADGVKIIANFAFSGCKSLTSITLPVGVSTIGDYAFCDCYKLTSFVLPSTIEYFGRLWCYYTLIKYIYIEKGDEERIWGLMSSLDNWGPITRYIFIEEDLSEIENWVKEDLPKRFAQKHGLDTSGYRRLFDEMFGVDYPIVFNAPSGKYGTNNVALTLEDEYVAGTDPTDPNSKFTASVTIVDGKPVVSYTPELDDARKALRKYTTYGKVKLTDADWVEVSEGHEADYNFFKVTVEMK